MSANSPPRTATLRFLLVLAMVVLMAGGFVSRGTAPSAGDASENAPRVEGSGAAPERSTR